jgi:hypothetical protein
MVRPFLTSPMSPVMLKKCGKCLFLRRFCVHPDTGNKVDFKKITSGRVHGIAC